MRDWWGGFNRGMRRRCSPGGNAESTGGRGRGVARGARLGGHGGLGAPTSALPVSPVHDVENSGPGGEAQQHRHLLQAAQPGPDAPL